jgi:hypothetical protein
VRRKSNFTADEPNGTKFNLSSWPIPFRLLRAFFPFSFGIWPSHREATERFLEGNSICFNNDSSRAVIQFQLNTNSKQHNRSLLLSGFVIWLSLKSNLHRKNSSKVEIKRSAPSLEFQFKLLHKQQKHHRLRRCRRYFIIVIKTIAKEATGCRAILPRRARNVDENAHCNKNPLF